MQGVDLQTQPATKAHGQKNGSNVVRLHFVLRYTTLHHRWLREDDLRPLEQSTLSDHKEQAVGLLQVQSLCTHASHDKTANENNIRFGDFDHKFWVAICRFPLVLCFLKGHPTNTAT